ncbi:aldehyde dehydrogenase family protein [Streptomyces sp. ASQP_92]|uniref:aldehyde dehydrogenase family protein n=1 Tax=Streptomyces sp. ASQP_92 TaxID=2979116 RepID=UPI0021C043D5|nr:aldehyde dehydrogenase family protein [Streptomyces sp. ASQP_92]MCT9093798.1 aldehyde dehydrogenase family protein [Streptomyces sp. ASQP_92]
MSPLPYTYEELLGPTMAQALSAETSPSTFTAHATVRSLLSGRPLPPLALCTAAGARQSIDHGREAQGAWQATGRAARHTVVIRLRREVTARRAAFAEVLRHTAGLGATDTAEECRDAERVLRHSTASSRHGARWWRSPLALSPLTRPSCEPPGSVPAVTVSYGDDARPLAALFEGALPSLLNGGAVITEVSTRNAPVALAAAALAREAGLPPGVWQVVVRGEAVGTSASGLRAVLAEHADALAPLCCPPGMGTPERTRSRPPCLLVLRHDGDAHAAARAAARACFARAGRSCAATPLIAVHAARATDFLEALIREAQGVTVTTALPDELHLRRLTTWAEGLIAGGAHSCLPHWRPPTHPVELVPQTPRPLLLVDPGALSDPRPEIPLGPVALVTRFTHWAEILEHAHYTGHHLSVFTRAPLSQLAPQFAGLPGRRIHLNQPPRAGLLP